jgi:transcriptional regulator of NAD metabolism
MQAQIRREQIEIRLRQAENALSASKLAKEFGVSRQVIVGDIALLRAAGMDIQATPRGYFLDSSENSGYTGSIACRHNKEGMRDELYTIVDLGGKILDVIVDHPVYGQLAGQLQIASRYDVDQFMNKLEKEKAQPLARVTDGVHLHTIVCPDRETFDRIVVALTEKNIIYN